MSELAFGNIILANSGKRGILLPDANGSYRLNAGGFNINNASGLGYPANDYIIGCMDENSDLQRRVSLGYCKMEAGHPKPEVYVLGEDGRKYKRPMTDLIEWIARLRDYDPDMLVANISKIFFLPEDDNDLRKPIYNEILCKPYMNTKYGPLFKEALDMPEDNTAVSIRTQIKPFRPGDILKEVVYWVGYDWVWEPGMVHANKHMSAGCEAFADEMNLSVGNAVRFRSADIIERIQDHIENATKNKDALEHNGGMEALDYFKDILEVVKREHRIGDTTKVGFGLSDIF